MAMLRLALSSLVLQPGLWDEEDDVQLWLIDDEYDVLSDPDELKAEDVVGFVEQLGPMEHEDRLNLMKASFGIPSEPRCNFDFRPLPECTRDLKHVGDQVWHEYYSMNEILETDLSLMCYTQCNDPLDGNQCFDEPTPILQIFNMKLQTCLVDVTSLVEVYGVVAVRDGEDYCCNYLFNRSRENPLNIGLIGGYIRLLSPKRGMSMKFNCLIEVDIRMKAVGDDIDDKTFVDGCMELIEGQVSFETFFRCTMSSPYGCAIFDMIMFEMGVEATIQLDFLEVPEEGFNIQMCGYTTIGKNLYAFIDKNCEVDSFISSAGRLPQYFVAAMQLGDNFLIDVTEGKSPLVFKSTLHGTKEKEYHFQNGALVSVKVSWSTAFF